MINLKETIQNFKAWCKHGPIAIEMLALYDFGLLDKIKSTELELMPSRYSITNYVVKPAGDCKYFWSMLTSECTLFVDIKLYHFRSR